MVILSIDLDIIFSPYVGIYNDLVGRFGWDKIAQEFNIQDFIPNQQYIDIIKQLLNYFKTTEIVFYKNHNAILKYTDNNNIIYNIDYHHDIFYGIQDNIKILQNISSVGNWVGLLSYTNKLMEYNWYHGHGCSFPRLLMEEINSAAIPQNIKYNYLENINISDLIQPDIIFISTSPAWIPPGNEELIQTILY